MHRVMLHDAIRVAPEGLDRTEFVITGDEAHHAARVKRVEIGEPIELLDGQGTIADARVTNIVKLGKKEGWAIHTRLHSLELAEPTRPELVVLSATPKGPRLESMIDQLSQAGAASWSPLSSTLTVVDPRDGKLGRLERASRESAKQCGRAWAMRVGRAERLEPAIAAGGTLVAADATGSPYHPIGAERITLLIGPEGGWTPSELDTMRASGVRIASFGVHTMRIETAAVVAAGIVLDAERRSRAAGEGER